jgi:hypothetical protein
LWIDLQQDVKYLYLFMHPSGAQLEEFCQWSLDGKVRPVIDKTFPLDKVVDAMTYLESNRATGKVIVEVGHCGHCLLRQPAFLECCTACVRLLHCHCCMITALSAAYTSLI